MIRIKLTKNADKTWSCWMSDEIEVTGFPTVGDAALFYAIVFTKMVSSAATESMHKQMLGAVLLHDPERKKQ
jgi:hypothetical protein